MKKLLISILLILPIYLMAAKYYISPSGSDAAAGSLAAPRFTLSSAWGLMRTSDTLYCMGGTYNYTTTQRCQNKSGTVTNRIAVLAYQNEKPVFDFYACRSTSLVIAFALGGQSYVHIRGLRFTNLPQLSGGQAQVGFMLASNTNLSLIEGCEIDHIGGYGLTISNNCDNNLILDCDSHNNEDPYTTPIAYDGANGFGMTANTTSDNNIFRRCRAWFNSDDGFDFYESNTYVELDQCWAFANGYNPSFNRTGNGVGFKLGPSTDGVQSVAKRKLTNCLAVDNPLAGFGANQINGGANQFPDILYNCSALRNGVGYHFQFNTTAHIFKNNLAYDNDVYDYLINGSSTQTTNSWQSATVTSADFISLDTAQLYAARGTNFSLPVITFLKLISGSDLIDSGTDVGISFNGTKPDIGAFESPKITKYYIAPTGSDGSGLGTNASPWFTLTKAWTKVTPGDTILVKNGTYRFTSRPEMVGKSGTASARIVVMGEPGTRPVISRTTGDYGINIGILLRKCDYVTVRDLDISGFYQPSTTTNLISGLLADSSGYCHFINLQVHDNGNGLRVQGNSPGTRVENCDFYRNSDPYSSYGNADGLDICFTTLRANTDTSWVTNCRVWWNSDDGFDFYSNNGVVVVDNCWSFWNGYQPGNFTSAGNGNGYKLGSTSSYPTSKKRIIKRSLAFQNRNDGFDINGARCIIELLNCTASGNGTGSGQFGIKLSDDANGEHMAHIIKNSLSYGNVYGDVNLTSYTTSTTSSHLNDNRQNGSFVINNLDFRSVTDTSILRTERVNGVLPSMRLLNLVKGSDLIDRGTNVGLSFNGFSPDLGSFESPRLSIYYISPNGNDTTGNGTINMPWRSLYKAVTTVTTAGDTIYVNAGRYAENRNCILSVGVNIMGEGRSYTTIVSGVINNYLLTLSSSASPNTQGNQFISGIYFSGNNKIARNCIYVNYRGGVTIKECSFYNFFSGAAAFVGYSNPENVKQEPSTWVTNNKFINNITFNNTQANTWPPNLWLTGQDGFICSGNTMTENQRGISEGNCLASHTNRRTKIFNNTLTRGPFILNTWHFTMELRYNYGEIEIYSNTCSTECDITYIWKQNLAYGLKFYNNTVGPASPTYSGDVGLQLEAEIESVQIYNNLFRGVYAAFYISSSTTGTGYAWNHVRNVTFRNNLCYELAPWVSPWNFLGNGVYFSGVNSTTWDNIDIINNTFVSVDSATTTAQSGIRLATGGVMNNIKVKNNIFVGFGNAFLYCSPNGSNTVSIDSLQVSNNISWNCGNSNNTSYVSVTMTNTIAQAAIKADPKLLADYKLSNTSPAINAGTDVGLLYNGIAPDIGYLELDSDIPSSKKTTLNGRYILMNQSINVK